MAKSLPPLDRIDPVEAWSPWKPDAKEPFTLKWAGHLYRRAAFGGNSTELMEASKRGLEATLDLLFTGEKNNQLLPSFLNSMGARIARNNNVFELRTWWLYCMLRSGHPLREKMTLFWHNHFATSIFKVNRTVLMQQQNQLLREYSLGQFGPFLLEISKDPAMLLYLDSNSNIKGRPNENYAREVMELFSLGVGNYTEKDIREAARAFTGWHTDSEKFEFNAGFHDEGVKTVLGKTGNLNGNDIVSICLEQPTCARFLVRKLYRFFVSEAHNPPESFLEPLARKLRENDYNIAVVVRAMLGSRHFFSDYAFRQRIKSPVEYTLGAVRTTVAGDINPQVLVQPLESQGQLLFSPPNVKGWPGGQAWLNSATILARQNFAQSLAMGKLWGDRVARNQNAVFTAVEDSVGPPGEVKPNLPEEPPPPPNLDPSRLIRESKASRADEMVTVLLDAYLPGGVNPSAQQKLVAFLENGNPTKEKRDRRIRETVHAILTMPEYQLA